MQHEDEDFVVANAGSNTITIATNAAGRGTDISLSNTAIKNGGLHVVFTFFPNNKRIEDQGAGRAGRQGNHGSYRIIVPHDDELLMAVKNHLLNKQMLLQINNINTDVSTNVGVKELNDYRDKMIEESSQVRRQSSLINLIQHKLLEKFCSWYQSHVLSDKFNKAVILSQWAEFYTSLENIVFPYSGMGNSNSNSLETSLIEYEVHLDKLFADFMLNQS